MLHFTPDQASGASRGNRSIPKRESTQKNDARCNNNWRTIIFVSDIIRIEAGSPLKHSGLFHSLKARHANAAKYLSLEEFSGNMGRG
jgi:hypothetical protein